MKYLFSLFICAPAAFGFVKLTPQAIQAFDRYIELTETKLNGDLQISGTPGLRERLRNGKTSIERATVLDRGKEIDVPNGLIQDWVGQLFIPGATIASVKSVLQDYENYKTFYQPEVIESRQLDHKGNEYDVFLRLRQKHFITVMLNTTYHVRYSSTDAKHLSVYSHSTRIAEISDPGRPNSDEEPVGNDDGFLWRLNSYWRFEEAHGGVYAECEAVSLSRDIPGFLSWMVKGLVESFPKESMDNTLRGAKEAVLHRK